ncbi:hypothetical protein MLPF_0708 [Mycobacterium lepromatosis]|nr:hypothetical protein MLPF_0708 [Mycobacterium lepromatosis]
MMYSQLLSSKINLGNMYTDPAGSYLLILAAQVWKAVG